MRRFLGPFNMGVWGILRVVADYAAYAHLGTTSTVFYKLPYHRGRGETKEADNVKNVVFSYLALTSFIAGIGIALYAVLFRGKLMPEMFWGLLVVSVLLVCRRIFTYYVTLLRANKDFGVLGRSVIFDAVVNFAMVLLLVRSFGLAGLFATVILMPVINVLFIRRFVDYDVKYRFNMKGLPGYIKFGFPLFITGVLAMILQSVDRIMIAKFLGLEALGFYSIALMARGYSVGLSRNFNVVITPHFLEDYGRTGDMATASKYLKIPAELMSTFMALLLGIVYIAAPPFVMHVLPGFTPGIMALKLLLLATFFYTASPQSEHFLIALNKQTRLVPIMGSVIVLDVVLNFLFIRMGFGITGVAAATAIASFAAFLITLIYAMAHIERIAGTLSFVFLVIAPLVYSVVVLMALEGLITPGGPFLGAAVRSVLFVLLFLPWIIRVDRRTAILTTARDVIFRRTGKKEGV
ncbi:MAG: oligosaccharide flippase family protein [Candidatus Omnitrophica bacterium]|nr:oligosaccharide flippase family protein [Candidatus Omnitrophota bacterium]